MDVLSWIIFLVLVTWSNATNSSNINQTLLVRKEDESGVHNSSVTPGRRRRTLYGTHCPSGCTSCSAANGCVTCKPRFFLYLKRTNMRQTGACVLSCPLGHFGTRNRQFKYCAKCKIKNCEECFTKNYCTKCAQDFLELRGGCVQQCVEGEAAKNGSRQCLPKGEKTAAALAVDCQAEEWSAWGVCSKKGKTCGFKHGIQTRVREIVQLPSSSGVQCPETTENRRCRLHHRICPAILSNDSEYETEAPLRRKKKQRRKERRKKQQRLWEAEQVIERMDEVPTGGKRRKHGRPRGRNRNSTRSEEISNQLEALLM